MSNVIGSTSYGSNSNSFSSNSNYSSAQYSATHNYGATTFGQSIVKALSKKVSDITSSDGPSYNKIDELSQPSKPKNYLPPQAPQVQNKNTFNQLSQKLVKPPEKKVNPDNSKN